MVGYPKDGHIYLWHWLATQGAPVSPCYLSFLFGIQGQAAELK